MKQLLKTNLSFIVPYILLLVICVILLLSYPKLELHVLLNQNNSSWQDIFFKNFTHLGDGTIVAIFAVILLFIKYRYAFPFICGSLFASGIINLLKHTVFNSFYRPIKYFEFHEIYDIHLVDGLNMHYNFSFPSGHTGTAFALFFMLALIVKNNKLKFLFFIFAVLVGYSRVYLSQHFLADTVAGSIIGTTVIFLFYFWFDKSGKNWLDYSLIKRR